jgi:hypothetical protein
MALSDDPVRRGAQLANLRPAPPAPRNNDNAETHGAHKTLPVDSVAAAIARGVEAETPLRGPDGGLPAADRVAVELLAGCLSRLARIGEWVEVHGPLDGKGKPRPVLEVERRLRNEAREHLRELGLTPRARVAIGITLQRGAGASLAELLSALDEPGSGGGEDG